jgi:hypothetical protein
MSAPVMSEQKLVGVIQICRKGFSLTSAGPDFTDADLKQLKLAASILAKKEFMASSAKT